MTSFSDSKCKKKTSAMCASHNAPKPALNKWQTILPVTATFKRKSKIPSVKKTKSFKRKMTIQAQWYPTKAGQILRARVCGKFTPMGANGATTCYPKKGPGMRLGRVFNAGFGQCIQASDFGAVTKARVKAKVIRLMRSSSPKKEIKKAILKDKLKRKKKAAQKKNNAVMARAIGGVKKKKKTEELELVMLDAEEFIDEGVTALAGAMLSSKGSFMLTEVASTPKRRKKVSNLKKKLKGAKKSKPTKQPKKSKTEFEA